MQEEREIETTKTAKSNIAILNLIFFMFMFFVMNKVGINYLKPLEFEYVGQVCLLQDESEMLITKTASIRIAVFVFKFFMVLNLYLIPTAKLTKLMFIQRLIY